jgi:uncharacterized protein (TIGR02246 family)
MTTTEVVSQYYATSARGDWEAWLALFQSDLEMFDVMGGTIRGQDQLRAHVRDIQRGYSKFLMSPVHMFVQGDEAAVIWHFTGANLSGVPIEARGSNYFRVTGGKIARLEEFFNPAPFAPFINQKLS